MVTLDDDSGGVITFPGRDRDEQFMFYFRQHWIRMVGPLARTVFTTALTVAVGITLFGFIDFGDAFIRRTLLITYCAFFAGVQFDLLTHFYRYFLYVIIVSDKKIHRIKKTLVAIDDHESVDLWVLQDISKSQRGLVQNILGFGSLILEAQNTQLRIHFVPRIDKVYHRLMTLKAHMNVQAQLWSEHSAQQHAQSLARVL